MLDNATSNGTAVPHLLGIQMLEASEEMVARSSMSGLNVWFSTSWSLDSTPNLRILKPCRNQK